MNRLHKSVYVVLFLILCTLGIGAQSNYVATIDGYVIDAFSGQSVVGAQVEISTGNQQWVWQTDDNGHFSGQIATSTENQLATVTVQAAGYGTWMMIDTPLFAGQTRLFPAIMLQSQPQVINAEGLPTDEPPPPPQYLQSGRAPMESGDLSRSPQFWSHDILPTSIRVAKTGYLHCGYWENGSYHLYPITNVYTVEFREYVKNVLPNEWISSWHPESLKAGAVAAKMFAWWRINVGPRGEWNGQEYDVRGDTCDQVYSANSQVSSTNAAVDATWTAVMRLNGLVSKIHYTSTIETCQNAGLSPCMGQWDSQYMALAGADFQTILMAFYSGFEITYPPGFIPNATAHTNLVSNGEFDNGFAFWSRAIGTDYATYNEGEGTFLAWKGRSGSAGVISQFLNVQLPVAAPVEVAIELGNTSNVSKTVRVILQRYTTVPDWNQSVTCQFDIAANTPLQRYVMRGTTAVAWENTRLRIEGYPVDNLPDITTDAVTVRYLPTQNIPAKQCFTPDATGVFAKFWDFTLLSRPYAWTIGSPSLINPTLLTAGIRYQTNGANPYLLGPSMTPVDAASNRYLYIKMASNADACGRIYFLKGNQRIFRETQAVDFTITPDGIMRQMVVDLGTNLNWTGNITRLRFDPACDGTASGKQITLERILLWDNPQPPQIPADVVRVMPQADTVLTDAITPTTFQWQPDANTVSYRFYLSGANGVVKDQWLKHDTVCNESICTLPETMLLKDGTYRWWMVGWSYEGYGSYNKSEFTVALAKPGLITRSTPTDTLIPIFQWQPRSDTVWYHFYLAGSNGVVIDQWHKGIDVCTETICTLPTVPSLKNDDYKWWMAGWNRAGKGPYDKVTFTINYPTPDEVVRITPANGEAVPSGTITLHWQAVENARWYRVYIKILNAPDYSQWVDGRLVCVDGECAHEVTLPVGVYDWWMVAWGPAGKGMWNKSTFTAN